MPHARPITPTGLVATLVERIVGAPSDHWLRVAVDGAPAARPADLADAMVNPLRERGRPVVRVRAEDYLRPASVRLERGREDPDAYYESWLDLAALNREALWPLAVGGTGLVRPRHWDAAADRAVRADPVQVPPGGVLVLSGALLLGAGLDVDLAVHLLLGPGALARRTASELVWTLPAFRRYEREVDPAALADVVVRVDDPRHPAVVDT